MNFSIIIPPKFINILVYSNILGKKVNNTKHALEKGLLYIFNNEIEKPREVKKIIREVT